MLNYIQAELWKASRTKGLYVLAILLVILTGLFAALMLLAEDFAQMASAAATTMLLGMLVAPLIAQVADGGALGTMKNEVSFGLSRRRIYLGKLVAGLLLGLGFCMVLIGGYLVVGWLFLPHGEGTDDLVALAAVGVALLGALPVWCGVYGLCHLLAMGIPSTAGWMAGYYLLSFFGQPILAALAGMWGGGQTAWLLQAIVMPASLLVPSFLPNWLTGEYLLWCWTIGMGWFILTTGLGLLWFRRREIK